VDGNDRNKADKHQWLGRKNTGIKEMQWHEWYLSEVAIQPPGNNRTHRQQDMELSWKNNVQEMTSELARRSETLPGYSRHGDQRRYAKPACNICRGAGYAVQEICDGARMINCMPCMDGHRVRPPPPSSGENGTGAEMASILLVVSPRTAQIAEYDPTRNGSSRSMPLHGKMPWRVKLKHARKKTACSLCTRQSSMQAKYDADRSKS
jgi:hypothetical protein